MVIQAPERSEPRRDGLDERAMLPGWLDYHRATLLAKCAGLSGDQLRQRSVPPSSLSLLGLVRHMAEVERAWFRRTLGAQDAPPLFYDDANRVVPQLTIPLLTEVSCGAAIVRIGGYVVAGRATAAPR